MSGKDLKQYVVSYDFEKQELGITPVLKVF
jgi:hypothetical protein